MIEVLSGLIALPFMAAFVLLAVVLLGPPLWIACSFVWLWGKFKQPGDHKS